MLCKPSPSCFDQHLVEACIGELAFYVRKVAPGHTTQDQPERKVGQVCPPEYLQQWILFSQLSFDCTHLVVQVNEQSDLLLPLIHLIGMQVCDRFTDRGRQVVDGMVRPNADVMVTGGDDELLANFFGARS